MSSSPGIVRSPYLNDHGRDLIILDSLRFRKQMRTFLSGWEPLKGRLERYVYLFVFDTTSHSNLLVLSQPHV